MNKQRNVREITAKWRTDALELREAADKKRGRADRVLFRLIALTLDECASEIDAADALTHPLSEGKADA